MNYKVSIIVPVYKAEQYLQQCVESLLAQTLDGVEIILVDDGSPDRCGEICDVYAARYDNIVVLHLQNGGPSRARNMGLTVAHGKYIGFADADDYVQPEMFEKLYREAEQNLADIVMCGYVIDDGNTRRSVKMEYEQEYSGHERIVKSLSALYSTRNHSGLYSVWNKLFINNLLHTHRIQFDERLIRAEDAWFVFDCLKVADKVRFVDEALYNYRQVLTSTMHTVQADRYERSKAFRVKLLAECDNLGIQVENNEFYYEFLYEAVLFCRSMMQQDKSEEIDKVLKDSYFQKACRYTKYLPVHIKAICYMSRMCFFIGAKALLMAWS